MQLTSGSSILRSGIWEHGFTAWICLEACTISQAGRSFTVNKFWLRLNCKITRCPLCLSFSLQPLPAFVVCQKKSNLHPVLPSPIYLSVCHLSISIYLHIYIYLYISYFINILPWHNDHLLWKLEQFLHISVIRMKVKNPLFWSSFENDNGKKILPDMKTGSKSCR